MSDGKLAEVVSLYQSNCRQIVETLRRNADAIEAGQQGDVSAVVMVMLKNVPRNDGSGTNDERVEVFGIGDTNYWASIGLLQGGVAHLTKMIQP